MADIEWAYCAKHLQSRIISSNYVIAPIWFTVSILMLVLLFMLIRSKLKHGMKTSRLLYYCGICLFLSGFFCSLLSGLTHAVHCHNGSFALYGILFTLAGQCYGLNYLILIALLYLRLYSIFKDSSMKLSKQTNVCFWSIYAFIVCATSVAGYFYVYAESHTLSFALSSFIFGSWMLLMIPVVYAFVDKLVMVHKQAEHVTIARLQNTITKSSMLAVISLTNSLVSTAFIASNQVHGDRHVNVIGWVIAAADVSTNAICTFLTYSHFTPFYTQLCGKCHRQWDRMWITCLKEESQTAKTEDNDGGAAHNVELQVVEKPTTQ